MKKLLGNKGNLFLIIAACAGILLLLIATFSSESSSATEEESESFERCEARLEERLKTLISALDGVSDVSVMLTLEDMPKGNDRPRVRGVAIVCRGCEDNNIRLRIVMLAAGSLGLSSDKIFVSPVSEP